MVKDRVIKMKGIVDRFEENLAIIELENKKFISIPKSKLPLNIKEGDVIIIKDDEIEIDFKKTSIIKKEIEALMDDLFEEKTPD